MFSDILCFIFNLLEGKCITAVLNFLILSLAGKSKCICPIYKVLTLDGLFSVNYNFTFSLILVSKIKIRYCNALCGRLSSLKQSVDIVVKLYGNIVLILGISNICRLLYRNYLLDRISELMTCLCRFKVIILIVCNLSE